MIRRGGRLAQGAVLVACALVLNGCAPQPDRASSPKSIGISFRSPSPQEKSAIDGTVTNYLEALASGDASEAASLHHLTFDLKQSRTSAFGRYASKPMSAFSVHSIQGESVSGTIKNSERQPAWVATATVGMVESKAPVTFMIRIGGVLGSRVTVLSATADASAR